MRRNANHAIPNIVRSKSCVSVETFLVINTHNLSSFMTQQGGRTDI